MKRLRALRSDRSAVAPVIATILMVAITVVLAAVLYVMVSGLLPGISPAKPIVSFGSASLNAGNATIAVAAASPAASPSSYRVNLEVGGSVGTATAMPTTSGGFVSIVIGGTTYRIYWVEIGGGNTVNAGDQFRVTGDNAPLPDAGSFVLYLLWNDGSSITQQGWTTP